jgi:hypothetical protein
MTAAEQRHAEQDAWNRARAIVEAGDFRFLTDEEFQIDYGIRACINAERAATAAEAAIKAQTATLKAELRQQKALFRRILAFTDNLPPRADSNLWLCLANVIRVD